MCRSLDVELDEFEAESFDCIVADNVLEHIGYYDYIQQNFYRIPRADGLLIISLPGEKALNRLFESKNDGHFLRRSKEIHSFLRKISKDFTDVGSLDTLPFFIARIFSKSSEI